MPEKRSHKRLEVKFSGRFKVQEISEDFFVTSIINVCEQGICFQSGLNIVRGKEVILEIQMDKDRKITLKTVSAWAKREKEGDSYLIGVRLIKEGSEDEKEFLSFFPEEILTKPGLKRKILLIDDEKELVSLVAMHFETAGYEVVTAYDGEEGYQKYLEASPDLIILDLKMPKLNGFEVCRKIRRENKDLHTPILMLTALQDDADRLVGKVVGAQRYVTKPFKIDELFKEVEWLLPAL